MKRDRLSRALDVAIAQLRWEIAASRVERALRSLHATWLERRYGYNPDEPRVPAGNPDGGR